MAREARSRGGHGVTHVELHRKEESQFAVTRVSGGDDVGLRKGTREGGGRWSEGARRGKRGNNECHSANRTVDI